MSNDWSNIKDPVIPDPGKCQWVKGKVTGIDDKQAARTHTVGVPHLMPGITIFVHGVNSYGEWYGMERNYSSGNVRSSKSPTKSRGDIIPKPYEVEAFEMAWFASRNRFSATERCA